MNESEIKDLLRVFYHELGHWFVAKQVGFTPENIQLEPGLRNKQQAGGFCSTVLYLKCQIDNISEYLINRQLVLLAGAVFEAIMTSPGLDKALDNLCNKTARNDYEKFFELAMMSLNLKLGEIEGTVGEIALQINIEGCDPLYQEIISHRDYLANIIYKSCKNENLMVSFYDEALILFERHLKKGFSVTPINITAEELNELYEKTVFHVFPAEEIIPFSQSSLRRF